VFAPGASSGESFEFAGGESHPSPQTIKASIMTPLKNSRISTFLAEQTRILIVFTPVQQGGFARTVPKSPILEFFLQFHLERASFSANPSCLEWEFVGG
jgi:hypothetical protein